MNKKIIYLGVVLAIFSFAIPQVTAQDSDMPGTYNGQYYTTNPGNGDINFVIDGEGLNGIMTIRGLECNIDLVLVAKIGSREVYRGEITREGCPTHCITIQIKTHPALGAVGDIRITGLKLEARFVASLLE
jgi:hypothetical protein